MDYQNQLALSKDSPILYYDGQCILCDGFVQFLIKVDKKEQFLFCALQQDNGKSIRKQLKMDQEITTVALLDQGKLYTQSDVTFRIIKILGGIWLLLMPLALIPVKVRNTIYRWIARNRYQWFGKAEQCILPDPQLKNRFI